MVRRKIEMKGPRDDSRGPFRLFTKQHGGYTLVEMMLTIVALAVVLRAMVALARHVRQSSANDVTREILTRLDAAMERYVTQYNDGAAPIIRPFVNAASGVQSSVALADEQAWPRVAVANNLAVVGLLRQYRVLPESSFADVSVSYYDGMEVRDAWGSPVVFMPRMDPAIGMSSSGWFFFSAGPDREFTTKVDNLYSYEARKPSGD